MVQKAVIFTGFTAVAVGEIVVVDTGVVVGKGILLGCGVGMGVAD